jgi:hypothetical protein
MGRVFILATVLAFVVWIPFDAIGGTVATAIGGALACVVFAVVFMAGVLIFAQTGVEPFHCPYCGKGLRTGASVCHHCGRTVGAA